jgi:beta-galactosidase/beta-glucuronidase
MPWLRSFDRAEERKVELMKKAGFNAVRTSHNLPSEVFLHACDRLGLLVIDEAFDGWRDQKIRMIILYYLTNGGKRNTVYGFT